MAEHDTTTTEPADDASNEQGEPKADASTSDSENLRRELLNAIGDLRAEVARLQVDEARGRLREWIRNNPTLAIFLATGTGIVAGRLLTKALTPSPPPPLSERARQRARLLADTARQRAHEVGEGLSKQAIEARKRADTARRDATERAAATGERLRTQARDWSSTVAERAAALRDQASDQAQTLSASIGEEAEGVGAAVAERAQGATNALRSSAERITDTADTVRSGYTAAKFGVKAAKLVFALLVAKKSSDWLRKIL